MGPCPLERAGGGGAEPGQRRELLVRRLVAQLHECCGEADRLGERVHADFELTRLLAVEEAGDESVEREREVLCTCDGIEVRG